MIKVVGFDFWETLIDFAPGEADRLKQLRVDYFADRLNLQGFEIPRSSILKAYLEVEAEDDQIRREEHREVRSRETIEKLLKTLGIPITGIVDQLDELSSRALLEVELIPIPDGETVLAQLNHQGYRLGLISNTAHGQAVAQLLFRFGLKRYFELLLFSDQFGFRKPKPEIFHFALDSLRVEPEEMAFVGDRPELDILGARRVGLYAIHFDPNHLPYPPDIPSPDATISRLSELPQALEAIKSKKKRC